MEGYELTAPPFFVNRESYVKLFRGMSKQRRQPVVAKCHELQFSDGKAEFIQQFTRVMNAGLTQARVEHLHSCKILEFALDVDMEQGSFYVYHILEALNKDVGRT